MELKVYLSILIKKWWIVLPTFLITLTTGIILTYSQTPIYSATATYVVVPSASLGSDVKSFVYGLDLLGRRQEIAATFAEIATSQHIKNKAAETISLESSEDYSIDSSLRTDTNIIEFTARGPDPEMTRDLVNSVGTTTEEYVKGSYEAFILRPLDEAETPFSPDSPKRRLNLILSAVLGLILGGGLAFLSTYLETSTNPIVADVNIIDHRTGVYNKDYFLRRLSGEMIRAKRNRYPLSVALMRINNLKQLKGMNAAQVRAEILHRVAMLTGQYLREEDLIAYMGDDIFAFLLPDMAGENAKAVMEYLQTRIGWIPFQSIPEGVKPNLKGIVGVATYNHNGTSRDDFIALADRALQLAEVNDNGNAYLVTDPMASDNPNA